MIRCAFSVGDRSSLHNGIHQDIHCILFSNCIPVVKLDTIKWVSDGLIQTDILQAIKFKTFTKASNCSIHNTKFEDLVQVKRLKMFI